MNTLVATRLSEKSTLAIVTAILLAADNNETGKSAMERAQEIIEQACEAVDERDP